MKYAFLAFVLITTSTRVFAATESPLPDTSVPVPSKTTDSNGDGVPDFAQLDSRTRGPFQLSLVKQSDLTGAPAQLKKETRSYFPTTAEGSASGAVVDKLQIGTTVPGFLKWNIQDSNSSQLGLDRQADRPIEFAPESPIKLSPLRLGISMEQLSPKRRQFRISVAGLPSSDQPVTVWVSTDLKTWNKVEDSMIETDASGNRQIVVPLNSKIQFFRVSSPQQ